LVNEFIDHIDYFNFLNNDITKIQRLRKQYFINPNESKYKTGISRLQELRECFQTNPFKLVKTKEKHYNLLRNEFIKIRHLNDKDFESFIVNQFNLIENFVNSDKDLKTIYQQLTLNAGKIETKLLYNKLVKLKQDLRETLYTIHYGVNYSDKDSSKDANNLTDVMKSAVMPFHESGKLELSDKEFNSLNINTIFCNKSDVNFVKNLKNGKYNNRKIDGSINVISEGEYRYNKGKFRKTYFIHYQYVPTIKQRNAFKRLLFNLKKSCVNDRKYKTFDNFKNYVPCTYTYPYFNQKTNFKAFKEHFKENIQTNLNIHYSYIYPYASKHNELRNKYLSFTSWNNNAYRDYLLRSKINRDLANILYNIDLNRKITNAYNTKKQNEFTRRKQRLFLRDLLVEIKANYLSKFNAYLSDLIKEYFNRIYLFETYGINALLNQIKRLQQFYDSNFENKRTTQAKHTKKAITSLVLLLPLRREYLEVLKMQRSTIDNNMINLNPSSVLIQSIIHQNIEKYLAKTIVRKIEQPRSTTELILMACNNLKLLHINYMDTMPVYIKEIDTEYNKFDELLNDKDRYKVEYIDKESTINVIALFKCIIKFDRYLELGDLYEHILELKITDDKKLKDYIYKEKDILNT